MTEEVKKTFLCFFLQQGFRRNENHVQLISCQPVQNGFPFYGILDRAVQRSAFQAHFPCHFHLVFHQNKQRADHHGAALAFSAVQLCADVINKALSPSGFLHDQDAFFRHSSLYGFILSFPKFSAGTISFQKDFVCFSENILPSDIHFLTFLLLCVGSLLYLSSLVRMHSAGMFCMKRLCGFSHAFPYFVTLNAEETRISFFFAREMAT